MSMRGMPQAENGGKMRRGTRKFTASAIIEFVPVSGNVTSSIRSSSSRIQPEASRRFSRETNEQNLARAAFDQPRLGFEYAAAARPSGRRQQDDIGLRGEGPGDAVLVESRRDHHDEIIDPGQGIDHICEFVKIQLAVASNRQKMKPRRRVAANDFGERGRSRKKIVERGFGARQMGMRHAGGGTFKIR